MAPVYPRKICKNSNEELGSNTASNCIGEDQKQYGLPYLLFMHCQEVRNSKASPLGISYTKYKLTEGLIKTTIKNMHKRSSDDLHTLSRETIFKKKLRRHMAHEKYRQMTQMAQIEKQKLKKALQLLSGEQATATYKASKKKANPSAINDAKSTSVAKTEPTI